MCNCRVCLRHRKLIRSIRSGSRAQILKLAVQLEDDCSHAEDALEHYKLILSGEWPGAVAILEKALHEAKEKEERRGH